MDDLEIQESHRIDSVDFFRGLVLLIVLIDHCAYIAQYTEILNWTVGGWGFSNAAEGFVFLSGMSFGWVYSKRIEQVGKYRSALKVIYRTFKTYCAFLVTLIAIWQIGRYAFEFSTVKRILDFHLSIEIVFLREQPAFVGVLCLYIIIIPFQLLLLFFLQRFWWLSFILSSFLFLLASQFPGFNLHTRTGNWIFNPFTWQFLMFIGVVTGSRMQNGKTWGHDTLMCGLDFLPLDLRYRHGLLAKLVLLVYFDSNHSK